MFVYLWLSVGSVRILLLPPVFKLPSRVLLSGVFNLHEFTPPFACILLACTETESMTFHTTSTASLKGSIMWLTGREQARFCFSQHDSYSINTEKKAHSTQLASFCISQKRSRQNWSQEKIGQCLESVSLELDFLFLKKTQPQCLTLSEYEV